MEEIGTYENLMRHLGTVKVQEEENSEQEQQVLEDALVAPPEASAEKPPPEPEEISCKNLQRFLPNWTQALVITSFLLTAGFGIDLILEAEVSKSAVVGTMDSGHHHLRKGITSNNPGHFGHLYGVLSLIIAAVLLGVSLYLWSRKKKDETTEVSEVPDGEYDILCSATAGGHERILVFTPGTVT